MKRRNRGRGLADDVDDDNFEEDTGFSPSTSPASSMYIHGGTELSSFMSNVSISKKGNKSKSTTQTPQQDPNDQREQQRKQDECVKSVKETLGVEFSDTAIRKAAKKNEWNVERTIDYLLNDQSNSKPEGSLFDMEDDSKPTKKTDQPVASQPQPQPQPQVQQQVQQQVQPQVSIFATPVTNSVGTGTKAPLSRPLRSLKTTTSSQPQQTQSTQQTQQQPIQQPIPQPTPTPTPVISNPTPKPQIETNQPKIDPPKQTPTQSSQKQQQQPKSKPIPTDSLPFGNGSKLAQHLCEDNSPSIDSTNNSNLLKILSNTSLFSISNASNFSTTTNNNNEMNNENEKNDDEKIIPFDFQTPSPDELVLEKRNRGITTQPNKGSKSAPISTPKTQQHALESASQHSPVGSHDEKSEEFTPIKKKQAQKTQTQPSTPANTTNTSSTPVQTPDPSRTTTAATPKQTPKANVAKFNAKQMNEKKRKEIESKILEQEKNEKNKKSVNLCVIGHVDSGKSTLIGQILVQLGFIDSKVIHKLEKEANLNGKPTFQFAYVMDEHEEERKRGVTINVGVRQFETQHRKVTILDAPGHKDFVPNMIGGAAQADVALLVVNARKGEFEAGFESYGQTKEHALLAKSVGVGQIGVVVNQMDAVAWSEKRFQDITEKISTFLKQTGFKPDSFWFLPCSAQSAENILTRKDPTLSKWYTGPTLVERIDSFEPQTRDFQKPFRLMISDIYKPLAGGSVAVGGKIESGFVSTGDTLALVPKNLVVTVKSITSHEAPIEFGSAGDNIDIVFKDVDPASFGVGDVLCDPETPLVPVRKFTARLITFAELPKPLLNGQIVELFQNAVSMPATIKKIRALLDRNGETKQLNARVITANQSALVDIETSKPLCVEVFSEFKQLGRFTLRSEGKTIAGGVVSEKL